MKKSQFSLLQILLYLASPLFFGLTFENREWNRTEDKKKLLFLHNRLFLVCCVRGRGKQKTKEKHLGKKEKTSQVSTGGFYTEKPVNCFCLAAKKANFSQKRSLEHTERYKRRNYPKHSCMNSTWCNKEDNKWVVVVRWCGKWKKEGNGEKNVAIVLMLYLFQLHETRQRERKKAFHSVNIFTLESNLKSTELIVNQVKRLLLENSSALFSHCCAPPPHS